MQSSNLGMWKGNHLSMEGIQKGVPVLPEMVRLRDWTWGGGGGVPVQNFVEYPPLVTKFSTFLPDKMAKRMHTTAFMVVYCVFNTPAY